MFIFGLESKGASMQQQVKPASVPKLERFAVSNLCFGILRNKL